MVSDELEDLLRDPHILRILIYLPISGPSPRSRIAKTLSIDYYALEKKLRYLEKQKLIAKHVSFSPRPRYIYTITDRGIELLKNLMDRVSNNVSRKV